MTKCSYGFSNPNASACAMIVLSHWAPQSPWVCGWLLGNELGSLRGPLRPSELVFQEINFFLLASLQVRPGTEAGVVK